ncbi:MAG TPA: HEAT repeat domain-containing protein [Beijerinckiaceae bacterium]|jgi:hypothetical protein
MLKAIWTVSLALAALSLAVMGFLVIARGFSESRRAKVAARRDALLASVIGWMAGETSDEHVTGELARDLDLSIDLLGELFEMVRGVEQGRLAGLAESAGVAGHLRAGLSRRSVAERLTAAETLAWFTSPETVAALDRALADPDPEVALAAASSLAQIGADRPVRQLLGPRFDRSDPSRRLEMVIARVARRRPGELAELALDAARTSRLRIAALDALAQAGAPEGIIAAETLAAQDPSVDIRVACARVLGLLGHPGVAPTLAALIGDAHWAVRAKAVESAGRLALTELAESIVALLSDENWWVRHRAAEAIERLREAGLATLKDLIERHQAVSVSKAPADRAARA